MEKPASRQIRLKKSDRTRVPLIRYIATELEPKLGRFVATERSSTRSLRSDQARAEVQSLRSDLALPKRRYDISLCILVYPSMLSPEDRREPISRSPPF
ncbi:hypothetical protein F2Q69_00022939 [Brassica cretica]|uniref:Uncharacterized protein n=1 Tax=Brassica cretica TaxID=69181 RepID=A0A8S9QMA9_BRACR|nr:hypothetical protein F2Q69_00022939 [Brassica cretica]